MHELLKLKEFGDRAETLVTLPDFAELDRRGRALHQRRLGAAAALVACVLAVVGLTVLRDDPGKTVEPAPDPGRSRTYPRGDVKTLDPGTYVLNPSSWKSDFPRARVTVPAGWSSWVGPTRFEGHAPGRDNDEALEDSTWYADVLILHVESVASGLCDTSQRFDVSTASSLNQAVSRIPGYRISREAESTAKFGYPATHFRLSTTAALRDCENAPGLFNAGGYGLLGSGDSDVWVVDVKGTPVLVYASWSPITPAAVRGEVTDVVDSIEFFLPQ